MTTTIIVRDEKLRQNALRLISALNVEKPWEITVKPYRKTRTLSQNALMWKWHGEVADAVSQHTGADKDDVHEFFKRKFLKPRIVEIGGEVLERYSTRSLKTAEMSDFMNRIYAYCTSELGMILPTPDEYGRDDYGRAA